VKEGNARRKRERVPQQWARREGRSAEVSCSPKFRKPRWKATVDGSGEILTPAEERLEGPAGKKKLVECAATLKGLVENPGSPEEERREA
jgi:hypothetical protein